MKENVEGRGRRGRRGERRVLNMAVIFCKLRPHVILDKLLAYGKNTKKRAHKYTI